MNNLYQKLRNSEFLSLTELLKLKIILVLIFLLIFGGISVPVAALEGFSLDVRLFAPMLFVILFILSLISLLVNKVRLSMHSTIYSIIALTIYYTESAYYFYGFLLIFISLTVMIFYQDIYTYVVYGGGLTLYGLYYISIRGDFLLAMHESNVFLSNLIYQFILAVFFIVYLMYFVLSDNMYEFLNNEYFKKNEMVKKQRKYCLKYINEINEKNGQQPIYETVKFQKVVSEMGVFINEFLEKKGENILETIEFYFFLHQQNIESVLNSSSATSLTKKYTNQLSKYLLSRDSEIYAIQFDVINRFKKGYSEINKRYETRVNEIYKNTSNRIMALLIIYKLLRSESILYDKWGQIEKSYTHEEIKELFQKKEVRQFLTYDDIRFFMQNEAYFENSL